MTINGSPAGSIPGGFPTRATYGPGLPPFNAAPAPSWRTGGRDEAMYLLRVFLERTSPLWP